MSNEKGVWPKSGGKCGLYRPGIAIAALTVVALAVSSCGDPGPKKKAGFVPAPEMVIKVGEEGGFACVSKAKFEEAIGHIVAGEKTKFAGMLSEADCLPMQKSDETFKVLSVQPGEVIEIVNTKSASTNGVWSAGSMFKPVK